MSRSVYQALASMTHGLRLYFMPVPLLGASRATWKSSAQPRPGRIL